MAIKILQVFNRYLEKGGEEKSVDRIFNHAKEAGFLVERCFFESSSWTGNKAPSKTEQMKGLFYNRDSAQRLTRKIEEHAPDVIIFHNIFPVGSPSLYKAAKEKRIPIIQFIHNFRPFSVSGTLWTGKRISSESLRGNYFKEIVSGSWQNSITKSFAFSLVLKFLHTTGWLNQVSHWIAISEFMRESFISAGVKETEITTLKHSWDMSQRSQKIEDKGYYLFLSRLTSEKGVLPLLAAWEALESQLAERCPTLIIGGTGPLESIVKSYSDQSDKIKFVGFVEQERKVELISQCRAMLAPSIWWEPLGLVTYEAYDHSKPMIASKSGGLGETILENVTGCFIEPNSADSIISVIQHFETLSDQDRSNMGKQGKQWLINNATPREWKNQFSSIITTVVKNHDS